MDTNENLILECLNELNKNALAKQNKEHNINLRKQSEIYGEVYELNYVNTDGEFAATILNPLDAYVLEDGH